MAANLINGNMTDWTVLVVDNEPDNVGVIYKVLTHYGIQVHTAEDGQRGLEVLAMTSPTFILMDLSMPRMDGWEMLRRVRSDPHTMSLPVIALTAHAMDGDKERAMAAGFDGYIAKPFGLSGFVDEIKEILGHQPNGEKAD